MAFDELLMITPNVVLSVLIWLTLLTVFLYIARTPARRLILAMSRVFHNALRLSSNAITRAELRLVDRNREVLLAAGREAKERVIEREFERINNTVHRDLARYPDAQRTLNSAIQRIEEDHQQATDSPPEVPGWGKAVEAVAKLPKADGTVAEVLDAIHKSMVKAQDAALEAYRKASATRHGLLSKMMPEWRRIQQTLRDMEKAVGSLLTRSQAIDRHMDEYEDIVKGTDRAVQMLHSSSLIHFAIAGLVLLVAAGGALINFTLIARPMAEMVGGTSFVGVFRTADIAAMVIIAVEISMGLFLMESLRITRLFPVIGALPDRVRVRMIWITFTILCVLASIEAGLAYMREILMQDELATSAALRGAATITIENDALWITTAAQMCLGFILPFALTFVAIPMETFIHSLRHVGGTVLVLMMRALAVTLRVIGNFFRYAGNLLLALYDVLIFLPLFIQGMWRRHRGGGDDYDDMDIGGSSGSGSGKSYSNSG
ncbi:MAG: hypothetical protein P8Y95_06510, partial [Gammaproteobacteria bacterium]